jgi:hypothetical protein
MWPFNKKAAPPPKDWTGPESFFDWSEDELRAISKAIRSRGQPDNDGFRSMALVALNTLRGGSAVELVARAMEASLNPGKDPDRPVTGNHYMRGMPHWCVWVEYARPAVEAYVRMHKP